MNDTPASLTPKQQEIFHYIRRYIEDNGYPPAIRDIGTAFDIRSPNGVMCHLKALQKKGYIHRDEKTETKGGKARAITIPGVSAGGFSLPLLGLIAAGKAIEAQEQHERLELKDLFGSDDLYALKVRGQSMIEGQIADGDYVVFQVVEVIPAAAETNAQAQTFVTEAARDTLYSDFVTGLRDELGVRVNQQTLNQLLALDTTTGQ